MSGFSIKADNDILNTIFRGIAWPTAANRSIGLFKSDSGLSNNTPSQWNEVTTSGTGYARVAMPNASVGAAANSQVANLTDYLFPIASTDWGIITHIAILDNTTGGSVIAWGALRNPTTLALQPREIFTGDQLALRTGALTIKLLDNPDV